MYLCVRERVCVCMRERERECLCSSNIVSLCVVPLVSRLLSATSNQAQAALSNVTSFLADNNRIVRDIDSLIARLSSVHSSIALVG